MNDEHGKFVSIAIDDDDDETILINIKPISYVMNFWIFQENSFQIIKHLPMKVMIEKNFNDLFIKLLFTLKYSQVFSQSIRCLILLRLGCFGLIMIAIIIIEKSF